LEKTGRNLDFPARIFPVKVKEKFYEGRKRKEKGRERGQASSHHFFSVYL
jgi:hypothetical protein